jgi:hypothetical protein
MKKYILFAITGLLTALGSLQAQSVRYIRIAQNSSGPSDSLHLAEVRAIASGTGVNVALNKTVTVDAERVVFPKANYVDGDPETMGGSAAAGRTAFVEIDLGAGFDLDRVEIVNRYSASANVAMRARNLQLTLRDANGDLLSSIAVDAYQEKDEALTTIWHFFEQAPDMRILRDCPTASNARLFLSKNAGSALEFTGEAGQSVSVPSALPIGNQDFTLEMWVKIPLVGQGGLTASEKVGTLVSTTTDGGNVIWSINENGQLSMDWAGTTATGTTDLRDGQWHHLLFTRDKAANTFEGYLDGATELSAATAGADVNFTADALRIGIESASGTEVFHGQIDELRVWNVRKADIPGHDPYREARPVSALELYYRFNEQVNATVFDYGLNARHGQLSSALVSGTPRISEALAPILFSSQLWSTGGIDTSIVAGASGKFWAVTRNGSGIISTDTFDLELPAIIQEDISCTEVSLSAVGGETFSWTGGATTSEITVTMAGTYSVTITSEGCSPVVVSKAVTMPQSSRYYRDTDGDGFGNELVFQDACSPPEGFVASSTDCDDSNAAIYPGATEICDGLDNDCDGAIDDGITVPTFYRDADGDGLGDPGFTVQACSAPLGYVASGSDCDDTNPSIGTSPDLNQYFRDSDGDGYGTAAETINSCAQPVGYVTASGDCDDSNPNVHPGAPENCDNIDDNCNGILIEGACPGFTTDVSGNCTTVSSANVLTGESFFNFGSASNAINTAMRSNFTIGQPLVGAYIGESVTGAFGFWGRFLLTPSAPSIKATEGELPDRIQVNWKPDPLSPVASAFKLYRNGALLASVDGESRSFIDFNVIAGQFYTYEVAGINSFGEGYRGKTLGFLNPNGVVTGRITTFSGNPVPGTIVTLSPTIGKSLNFNQLGSSFAEYSPKFPRTNFTVSCWVKIGDNNDKAAIFDLGSHLGKNWWLHTQPQGAEKGIVFGVGRNQGDVTEMAYTFPADQADGWHYVAATFNGASLLLYVDGELAGTTVATLQSAESVLFLGQKPTGGGNFNGKLDELRFFERQLAQTEIQMFMNQSISSTSPGLVAYWKFDEGVGSKAFDLTANKFPVYHCGTQWDNDKPDVVNAAISDIDGSYKVEGINYGAGATFTATPSKFFYYNQSLEFNAVNSQYADLTSFGLTDSASITITVKAFDFSGNQTLLSKADASGNNQFLLSLNSGNLELSIGANKQSFGALGMGFHHLAFIMQKQGSSLNVTLFKNGTQIVTRQFSSIDTWAGKPWKLGARANGPTGHTAYFTGLIDEVAFFSELLPVFKLQEYANIGTNVTDKMLSSFFNLNEGTDTLLQDLGAALTGKGVLKGAQWSTVAAISRTEPHKFTPSSRLVTLNPSNTSVDQIDFTDQSTIPVSGYVRYEGTDCFVAGAEIYVNGQRAIPPVFTNEDGYFSLEMAPGATAQLSPVYNGHNFFPAFWEVFKASSPVAGILFRDQVKREVSGQMAGNEICRKSIIPDGAIVKVKVESLDGCFYQEQRLTNPNGKYVFKNLPPIPMTVAVTEHSNSEIYNFFQLLGGSNIDLTNKNDTVDFIYYSQPEIELSRLDTNPCGEQMLLQSSTYTTEIKVYQPYDGGRCYLDTAALTIDNSIAEKAAFDTLMTQGSLKHQFKANMPNVAFPYTKNLTVKATADNKSNTASTNVVVLGKRPRNVNFASTTPSIPLMILRDPPGDGSSATIEKGTEVCNGWSIGTSAEMKATTGLQIDLGTETVVSAGIGAEVETKTELKNSTTMNMSISTKGNFNKSAEVCLTSTETISTSSDGVLQGDDADVYVGGTFNLLFGLTDKLEFDTLNCAYVLGKDLVVFPDRFASTFLYSGYQIKKVVIPNLELVGDTTSANQWRAMLQRNEDLKKRAVFQRNLTFDAGVTYENSSAITNTDETKFGFSIDVSSSINASLGFAFNGLGNAFTMGMEINMGVSSDFSRKETNTQTVTYTLADDDLKDSYTIDVLEDRVYGTPVFKIVSGVTSCPHDSGTVSRDALTLTVDRTIATNVLANEPAVFKFNLGNISETDESRFYSLALFNASNPKGARVKIQGESKSSGNFLISPGQSQEITVTVERGPIEYTYENLSIYAISDCEGARYDALGNGDWPPPPFYKEILLDVYFLEPCSPIDIGFPLQNWVVTPAAGDTLFITLNKFNRNDTDLELIRVQYRRKQGDGAWINIAEIPKAALDNDVFKIVPWVTTGLKDGEYEIRAVTQCTGGQNAGISTVISGRFEREPPEIFGTPEPADGVLSIGDEISITFTEPIKCDGLIQADFFNNNNIGLYNSQTGELVDAVISCNDDKIVIVPNVPNRFIENTVLRMQVNNIKDLVGNNFLEKKWEFFVDRNPVRWVEDQIEVVKLEEETVSVTRKLENIGGQALVYDLQGIPGWVKVFPMSGTLAPGGSQNVVFEFDDATALGLYSDTIYADGPLGAEPLYLDLRVACPAPTWTLNRAGYSFSMNMTLELNIEGTVSHDRMDIVAAFVGRELRGLGKVQYSPELKKHLVFLTVYSNVAAGETVTFQVWDASACKLYGSTIESFTFEADGLLGSPLVPQSLRTNNMLLAKVPIRPGWNWISYNVDLMDPAINKGLESLSSPQGGLIKGQTAFSSYSGALQTWAGNLKNLSHLTMYQYRSNAVDSLQLLGMPVDPSTPIPVTTGWNWLGFLPQRGMRVWEALGSLTPLNGDLVKGQFTFAQYVAGLGWIGNLSFMSSPNGYLLKLSLPGTLVYPSSVPGNNAQEGPAEKSNPSPVAPEVLPYSYWKVKPEAYEQSMNIIAVVERPGEGNILGEGDEVGAFFREEVRGSSQVLYIEALDAYLVFLTVYANREGEPIRFRYYDASAGRVIELNEIAVFRGNSLQGLAEKPLVLTPAAPTGVKPLEGLEGDLKVYPNPTEDVAFLQFDLSERQMLTVSVTDALGREVWRTDYEGLAGRNIVEWRPEPGLPSGWYFATLRSAKGVRTAKVEVVR